jgi:hypothetical protein
MLSRIADLDEKIDLLQGGAFGATVLDVPPELAPDIIATLKRTRRAIYRHANRDEGPKPIDKPRRPRTAAQLRATAYHEAGHAVAAIRLRTGIRHATIVQGQDTLGHVTGGGARWLVEMRRGRLSASRTNAKIVEYLAGEEAARRHTGRRKLVGGRHDHQNAVEIACAVYGHNPSTLIYLRWMALRTREFLEQWDVWLEVKAVAAAFLRRRTLRGTDTRKITRSAVDRSIRSRHAPAIRA